MELILLYLISTLFESPNAENVLQFFLYTR
jgi:hypothetical protein